VVVAKKRDQNKVLMLSLEEKEEEEEEGRGMAAATAAGVMCREGGREGGAAWMRQDSG